jgi:acetoin utilization deacetylase AcuC-like enzyme
MRHDLGWGHPERPARLSAINDRLIASGLDMVLLRFDAEVATREQLEACHSPEYIDRIFATSPKEGVVWLDEDTGMNPWTLEAALRAAGAGVRGVDLVVEGSATRVFCNVRPPGHHATRDRAMGFCLFNNVAVAANHALHQHQLERVAIVDFDVHQGNGTEEMVSGDGRILFCSTFQHPFYPFSGSLESAHNVVNVPLRAGTGSAEFREAVERAWLPRLESFAPRLILVSAGFDAHQSDPMSGLALVADDYAWVTHRLCAQAGRSAEGRIVSLLEGGYELHALTSSVEAHLKALMGYPEEA